MSTWDAISDLRLEVEGYALERLDSATTSGFARSSTVIALRGVGARGLGEDVTYATEDHDALNAAGPTLPLAGRWTLATLLRSPRRPGSVPRAAGRRGLPPLPPLGFRVRRARPRAPPGRPLAPRGARPRAAARSPSSRRCACPIRPRSRPSRPASRSTPTCASSSTRRRAGTRALIAELARRGIVATADLKGFY